MFIWPFWDFLSQTDKRAQTQKLSNKCSNRLFIPSFFFFFKGHLHLITPWWPRLLWHSRYFADQVFLTSFFHSKLDLSVLPYFTNRSAELLSSNAAGLPACVLLAPSAPAAHSFEREIEARAKGCDTIQEPGPSPLGLGTHHIALFSSSFHALVRCRTVRNAAEAGRVDLAWTNQSTNFGGLFLIGGHVRSWSGFRFFFFFGIWFGMKRLVGRPCPSIAAPFGAAWGIFWKVSYVRTHLRETAEKRSLYSIL